MAINGKGRPSKRQIAERELVNFLSGEMAAYNREFSRWISRTERILQRYRDEQRNSSDSSAKFNILWSNVQTLIPAVYFRTPMPDVSRRFKDNDPVGRVASLLLERALEYEVEHYPDYRETGGECVLDRFLGGRGQAWARYEPHMRARQEQIPVEGVQVTEDQDDPDEELDYECAPVDYVHWRDFGHSVARTWDEVRLVWRNVYLTREACIERFGPELGSQIPLDSRPENSTTKTGVQSESEGQFLACVHEIWDKEKKEAIWLAKSTKQILDRRTDPLGLEEFFPCPKPLYSTLTNESLVPVPDFTLYQDQARELDTLADRIEGLIRALQVKGVYDASQPALARLFTEGTNGTLIPVNSWQAFAEKNGLSGSIDIVDLKPIYEALRVCFDAAQGILKQIYDLTGLADIVRGQSEASETATAQRIKGQYASLRLKAMQNRVAIFFTQLLQLKAQIICAKFDPKTIATIGAASQLLPADQQLVPQAMALLIGTERMMDPAADPGPNPMRNFRIEVNADSMVQADEQQEKENRNEFMVAQGQFMEKALPLVKAAPQVAPLIATLWKFSVQAFKVGKTIEGEFDAMIDKLKQFAAQPQQPQPNPDMMRVQMEGQIQQMRMQGDQQQAQQKMQLDQAIAAMEARNENMRLQMENNMKVQQMQFEQNFERWKALLDAKTKLDVAEIGAQSAITPQQIGATSMATQ